MQYLGSRQDGLVSPENNSNIIPTCQNGVIIGLKWPDFCPIFMPLKIGSIVFNSGDNNDCGKSFFDGRIMVLAPYKLRNDNKPSLRMKW